MLQSDEGEVWKGWIVLIFCGLCSVVGPILAIVMLIPGSSYLKLTREGFEISYFFRKTFIRWSEVDSFRVVAVNGVKPMVYFDYNQNYQKRAVARYLSNIIAGVEAGLPDNYGKDPEELARLMNEWKQKYAPTSALTS